MKKVLILLTVLLTLSLGISAHADEKPHMTVLYASFLDFLMDLPIAIEEGYFEELGLDLDAKDIQSSPTRNAMLAKGEVDGSFLPSQAALTFAEKGLKLVMVCGIGNRTFDYAVLADSPVKSLKDFQGKTVASVPNPSNPRLALDYDMKQAGVTAEIITTKTAADRLSMLVSKKVDIIFSAPATEARLGDEMRVVHTATTSKYLWNSCGWFFKPEYIKNNPEAIKLFVAGLEKARKLIQEDPQKAIEVYSKYNRLQNDDYKKPFALPVFDAPAKIYGYGLEKTYAMMKDYGLLKKEIDVSTMVSGDFAQMVDTDY